jgi:energy-coupling factor transport system permease protein
MHPLAWVAWVSLVMTVALVTTNPLYLGVVFLCVILVSVLAPRTANGIAGFRALLIFGVGMFAVSLLIATVNGNYGDHILFTIPGPAIPHWLGGLRLGGPVSAEGLVAASIRGLAILCVLLAFGVFNGAVSPHSVLRSTPAALFHAGLVVTVGLTLLPASIEDVRRIREMRALRGARAGLRQLPALVVPAVINGLERSMRLAEAMEARGYGAAPPGPRGAQVIGAAAAPLFVVAAWGWYYYEWSRPLALGAALLGLGALAFWGMAAARRRHTTRFNTEPMPAADRACIGLSAGGVALAIVAGSADWFALKYNPFAGLAAPPFSVVGALLALSCAWPAVRIAFAPARASESAEADAVVSAEAVRT